MNTPVKNYFEKNMNNFKSLSKMSTQINKDFGLSTKYHQIYYMQSKILKEKFGNPSKDAMLLIQLAEDEQAQSNCRYSYDLDEQNALSRFFYVSKSMIVDSQFYDVIILDSTLGKNKFNMPLINFICINKHGQSLIIGFGLV